MGSTGYIGRDGKYHKIAKVPLKALVRPQQSVFKQGDHAKQRFDHSAEIVQPFTVDGKPNPVFIEAFPTDAAQYGFIPTTGLIREPDPLGPSDTPSPGEKGYGGSTPWNYRAQPNSRA